MKVVFLEDVPGTAKIGEIKDVKPGFARNYLLPRRIAMAATPAVVKSAEARAVREARLQEARDNEARTVADKVSAATMTISARAGSSGKLFGSVGTADIAAKLAEITGQEVDRHNVLLAEPVKDLGDYEVTVRLTRNVNATAHVTVIGEDGTTAADIRARQEAEQGEKPAADMAVAEEDLPETDESDGSDEYAAEEAGEKADQE
ncbi:MAG TPA: 50S ribosomal protein L9 [Dehalococcoidia bacterium]|nr:50S ribosomal protein L9 [Dehalococcoidia bacterium]